MKKTGYWVGVAGIVFIIVCVSFKMLFFPRHPWNWYKLEDLMPRSEVLILLDVQHLTCIERDFNAVMFPYEVWVKDYWFGRWTIKCRYYKENFKFLNARVSYESFVFPSIKRLRIYPPASGPPLID
jgi:hypothetical protein